MFLFVETMSSIKNYSIMLLQIAIHTNISKRCDKTLLFPWKYLYKIKTASGCVYVPLHTRYEYFLHQFKREPLNKHFSVTTLYYELYSREPIEVSMQVYYNGN